MGDITGRWVAISDVSIFTVGDEDVKAIFRNANLEVTAEEIDVTVAMDLWRKREYGVRDWRVTCSNLVETSSKFIEKVVDGGTIVVSFQTEDGFSFVGEGMITGSPLSIDNPMTEEITVVSAGEAPTITP